MWYSSREPCVSGSPLGLRPQFTSSAQGFAVGTVRRKLICCAIQPCRVVARHEDCTVRGTTSCSSTFVLCAVQHSIVQSCPFVGLQALSYWAYKDRADVVFLVWSQGRGYGFSPD